MTDSERVDAHAGLAEGTGLAFNAISVSRSMLVSDHVGAWAAAVAIEADQALAQYV